MGKKSLKLKRSTSKLVLNISHGSSTNLKGDIGKQYIT